MTNLCFFVQRYLQAMAEGRGGVLLQRCADGSVAGEARGSSRQCCQPHAL